jgi:hypothetical protein
MLLGQAFLTPLKLTDVHERDQRLTQNVFVTPEHGVGAAPARGPFGAREVLAGQCRQRHLLHVNSFPVSSING